VRTTIATGFVDALAFGPDGTLYWGSGCASPSGFGTIDPATGARTTIAGGWYSALASSAIPEPSTALLLGLGLAALASYRRP